MCEHLDKMQKPLNKYETPLHRNLIFQAILCCHITELLPDVYFPSISQGSYHQEYQDS